MNKNIFLIINFLVINITNSLLSIDLEEEEEVAKEFKISISLEELKKTPRVTPRQAVSAYKDNQQDPPWKNAREAMMRIPKDYQMTPPSTPTPTSPQSHIPKNPFKTPSIQKAWVQAFNTQSPQRHRSQSAPTISLQRSITPIPEETVATFAPITLPPTPRETPTIPEESAE